ncbi:hypothetical protein BU24DRAFT_497607 [Aaosphaeria arxii CBS 175.79]|uniref:Zn(2)-C6 fungal-type domain-containing protein n=1 Tax=Aaosphaeria arxii CBS 175.79 TaxID=1450172 RepID=A0A6A5X7Y7_9PLEO|nr:uncharacterized protein BU24DRAFT_497607 [Aaosphaeria arxii CBS 175.79]KAF2009052.1 hypothetical protein BU24DRAFT_497607 [Aaosphaeria arxii CBS 175.79]
MPSNSERSESVRSNRHSPYLNRRTRHACENCRRKKSRCPGEKPECSFCTRLKQKCVYVSSDRLSGRGIDGGGDTRERRNTTDRLEASTDATSERLRSIESKLESLTDVLGSRLPQTDQSQRHAHTPHERHTPPDINLSKELISEGIELYFAHFCNQPCPLFDHLRLSPSFHHFSPIVLYPMFALSLRASTHPELSTHAQRRSLIRDLTSKSWTLLVNAYAEFEVTNAYFQALCLLAQVDFGEGNPDRARAQLALGLRLAQSRGMLDRKYYDSVGSVGSTCAQEIVWTMFMLERMYIGGTIRAPSIPSAMFNLPTFEGGPSLPATNDVSRDASGFRPPYKSPGIVEIGIRIVKIWEMVIVDINHPTTDTDVPFWRHDSIWAAILSSLLDFELDGEQHTYASMGPPASALEKPHLKPYYLTWLFYQLVHSAIHCCLYHPFIILTKTQSLSNRVPLTFLQKSHHSSLIYANWVHRFLVESSAAHLPVHHCPFLAYLVGIVASIHLESSSSSSNSAAGSAIRKFEKCVEFLRRVARESWPGVARTVGVLERLRERMGGTGREGMSYVEVEYDGGVPIGRARKVGLEEDEVELMWSLFDFSGVARGEEAEVRGVRGDEEMGTGMEAERVAGEVGDVNVEVTAESDVDAIDSFAGVDWSDWSLFGRPWLAYFPPDHDMGFQ